MGDAELAHRFAAQGGILLALRCREQMRSIAPDHIAAQNGAFYLHLAAGSIDFCQRLTRLRAAKQSEILDGLPLQFGIALPAGYLPENLARLWRPVLGQHEESFGFFFRRCRAI